MKISLVVTALALAACDSPNDQNDAHGPPDRMNQPPGRPGAPPQGADGREMGHPNVDGTADGRPPMGRDGRDGQGGQGGRDGRESFRVDPSDPNSANVEELVAIVSGDPKHKALSGKVTFHTRGGNVQVDAVVDGLPKGEHGYHVHVFGDCSNLAAKSPGEHFDFDAAMAGPPGGSANGSNAPGMAGTAAGSGGGTASGMGAGTGSGGATPMGTTTDVAMRGSHVMGNLGELAADDKGHAIASMAVDARLRPLLGRAVVIHEKGNDEAQRDGAAGDPIACGVIGIANPDVKASASKEPESK